jgi:outer membrane protein TolC
MIMRRLRIARYIPSVLLTCFFAITVTDSRADNSLDSVQPESVAATTLELDLKTAIRYALRRNREIAIARYQPDIAQEDVKVAESVYDFNVFSTGGLTRGNRPTQSLLDTGSEEIDELAENRWLIQAGVKKHIETGGTLSLYQELDYLDSNSEFVEPNPQNTSRLRVELQQPLLQNIGDQENKAATETAQMNVVTARESTRRQINQITYNIVNAYRQLQLERKLYDLQKTNLQMAKDIYKIEQERFRLGISKDIDVNRAQSAIENRRIRLLRSFNRLQTVVYQLRLLLNFPQPSPGKIIPTESSTVTLPDFAISDLIEEAFLKRPEIKIAENGLASAEINMRLYGHLKLPELNARGDFNLNSLAEDAEDAFKEVYSDSGEGWSVWLDFNYPLGNNGAKAKYTKASLEYRQAREEVLHTKDVVQQEIQSVVQDVEISHRQIAAALAAQQAAVKVLKGEMANYELTRTTNKDLLQAQNLLAAAQREHLRAVTHFNLKLAQLDQAKGTLLESLTGEP